MKYIILTILLFSFFSCTENITIHTKNSPPVIVIYGELTNEFTHQSINITWSSPYFDALPNAGVSGASVKITRSDSEIYELFENDTVPGLYETETKWAVTDGVTYSLKVDVNSDGNKKTYEATTTIFPSNGLDSIKIVPNSMMGRKNYLLYLYGNEPEGKDFYLCKYVVRDSLITTKISRYNMLDDIMFNGQYINGVPLMSFGSIENWEKDPEERREYSIYLASGDKVELQMSKVSKEYFDFVTQCQRGMRGSNPFFGGPPANIITNISNGGCGFFTGYCINKAETVTP